MFIVVSYSMAVIFGVITKLCWSSWANTQKLVQGRWRFELFHRDNVIGIFLFSLIVAFTLGSTGEEGRPFLQDLDQADWEKIRNAIVGGVVFYLANILLTAVIAGAGMAVAFPIGIGIVLILGVLFNYLLAARGNAVLPGLRLIIKAAK